MKYGGDFDTDTLKNEINILEDEIAKPEFWENQKKSEYTFSTLKKKKNRLGTWVDIRKKIEEINKAGDDIAICIADINMPVMDGITFVKEYRKNDKFTPILILTTESDENKIKEGKDAGVSGWIVKPFQSEQLNDIVTKLII